MKNRAWLHGLLGLAAAAGIGGCRDYPTKSIYHSPVISSVTVFPSIIGQGDSVLVTVYASDPDGDALVYDWFTAVSYTHLGQAEQARPALEAALRDLETLAGAHAAVRDALEQANLAQDEIARLREAQAEALSLIHI